MISQPETRFRNRFENAQRLYSSALLGMREVYEQISDDRNFFGFAPDFIPFPALDPADINAFEKVLVIAKEKVDRAAEKESLALSQTREFDSDSESIQSELVSIANNYEDQLGEICGIFEGSDGSIYPAIQKHQDKLDVLSGIVDPCGMVGNGSINELQGEIQIEVVAFDAIKARTSAIIESIEIEAQRAADQCGVQKDLKEFTREKNGVVSSIGDEISAIETELSGLERSLSALDSHLGHSISIAGLCDSLDSAIGCGIAVGAELVFLTAEAVIDGNITYQEGLLSDQEVLIQEELDKFEEGSFGFVCDEYEIDSQAKMDTLALDIDQTHYDARQSLYRTQLLAAELDELRKRAQQLQAQQIESEQLAINIEASRNDPNVRIYKNDAVLSAERTFNSAIKELYKLTKIYEYYTSQSYARLGDLFLIRMTAHGDISLESYLDELQDAFIEFEEQFGNPDLRVVVFSTKDDLLQIPRIAGDGRSLSTSERVGLFRERMSNVRWLDKNGYMTIPFSTTFARLSPLTRNHKIRWVEAEDDWRNG